MDYDQELTYEIIGDNSTAQDKDITKDRYLGSFELSFNEGYNQSPNRKGTFVLRDRLNEKIVDRGVINITRSKKHLQ